MEVKQLNSFYFIHKVETHKDIKEDLLGLIANQQDDPISFNETTHISRTDYHLDETHKRSYLPKFFEAIDSILREQAEYMLANQMTVHHSWYQQYHNFDKHDWHTHGYAQFANIYYLELPNNEDKTDFFSILDKKIITDIDIKEGDLITFPAYILHRSNTNSMKRKTIISFNSSFDSIIEKKVDELL